MLTSGRGWKKRDCKDDPIAPFADNLPPAFSTPSRFSNPGVFLMIVKEYYFLEGRKSLTRQTNEKMALAESLGAFLLTVFNSCVADGTISWFITLIKGEHTTRVTRGLWQGW